MVLDRNSFIRKHHSGGRIVSPASTPQDRQVRKSRTYDDSMVPVVRSSSSSGINMSQSRRAVPSSSTFTRESTTTTRTTAIPLAALADPGDSDDTTFRASIGLLSGKLEKIRRKQRGPKSRGSKDSRSKSRSKARNGSAASTVGSLASESRHPFDEDLSSRKSAEPEQGDLMNMAYSYSMLEEDSGSINGDTFGVNRVVRSHSNPRSYQRPDPIVVDVEEKDEQDEDMFIPSPPRLSSSFHRDDDFGVTRTRSTPTFAMNNSSGLTAERSLTKDDVAELVQAIQDISDCVNSLKSAVLPEAHQIIKDVDVSLRGSAAGDTSASSMSSNDQSQDVRQLPERNHISNSTTTATPPPPRRSLPDFLLQQETPLTANTSKQRPKSRSSTPTTHTTVDASTSTTSQPSNSTTRQAAAALVQTLSKASASAEYAARTIHQQLSKSFSQAQDSEQSSKVDDDDDEDTDDDDDELLTEMEQDDMKMWQDSNADSAAANKSGSFHNVANESLNRINTMLFSSINKSPATSQSSHDSTQQQSPGQAYHSFRHDSDEGCHNYYMPSGKAPHVHCRTTCLPMSNIYNDYVESFANLKKHCNAAATGLNMNFPWESSVSAPCFHPTKSSPLRARSGGAARGSGDGRGLGRRAATNGKQTPISQNSSYSDDDREEWLQDEYDNFDEDNDIQHFMKRYYNTGATGVGASMRHPAISKNTTSNASFLLQSPSNLSRVPTDQEEKKSDAGHGVHHHRDTNKNKWLASESRAPGLDPATVLKETRDRHYHHQSLSKASATPSSSSSHVHHV